MGNTCKSMADSCQFMAKTVMPDVRIPEREERRPPDNATRKKGSLLLSGLLPHPTQWCRLREPRAQAQAVTQIYRVSTHRW